MFYRTQKSIRELSLKYYEEDATCPAGHTNPTEFIPYSSLPFFSPTTIRNVVKALRNDEQFVDVHFYNPQIASAYTHLNTAIGTVFGAPSLHTAYGGMFYVIPIEVVCVFMLNAPPSSLPETVTYSKGYMHYDAWDGKWKYRNGSIANTQDSAIVDRWDNFIKTVRKGNISLVDSMRASSKKKFLCRVRLTWFMTELHTIIRYHNSTSRSALSTIARYYKNNANAYNKAHTGLSIRTNTSGIDRRNLPHPDKIKSLTSGYKDRRARLREIHRAHKIPYGVHVIFNNYPSYFFNFLDGLSSKEKSNIRARFTLVHAPDASLDDGFIARTDGVKPLSSNPLRSAPKFWWTRGVYLSCDCCGNDDFVQHNMSLFPHTRKWLENKSVFKRYIEIVRKGEAGLNQIGNYPIFTMPPVYRRLFGIDDRLLVNYRDEYRALATRKFLAKQRQQQQIQQRRSTAPVPVDAERRKMLPQDIPNNILWQHALFNFNKKARMSPTDHINLLTQGVTSLKEFLNGNATTAVQTTAEAEATPTDPDLNLDPTSVLLSSVDYVQLHERMVHPLNVLISPFVVNSYNSRYAKEEQYKTFNNSEITGADIVCTNCMHDIDMYGHVVKTIISTSNPVLVTAGVDNDINRMYGNSSRLGSSMDAEEYRNGTSKYFHRLLAHLQGGHSSHTLQYYGNTGLTLDPKDRIIKNYSDNPLHYGVFSRTANERPRMETPVAITGAVGSPLSRLVFNSNANATKIDKTCYLGVELEVTANKKTFDLARGYHLELGANPDELQDYQIKELGLFIAASTCDRFFVENNRSAIIKYDGSTSEIGFEIVSVPGTHAWHLNEGWKGFFKEDFQNPIEQEYAPSSFLAGWVNNGSVGTCPWNEKYPQEYIRPTCGIHIHVSKDALTHLQLGKMLVFVNANEDKFIEKIAGRSANSYSRFYDKSIKSGLALSRRGTTLNGPNTRRDGLERYEAINLTSGKNTVEFRIFRSNVAKAGFFKCIDFVQALVDWTREESNANINNKHFIGFVMANRGKYPWLSKWLIDAKYVQTVPALNPKFTPSFAD